MCIFFSFKIYETEIKFCYGTDAYGEEVVSNNPKSYDISINLRCWVYSVGRSVCTSHPNPKISKKIAICLSEEKIRNAALYPQTTHIADAGRLCQAVMTERDLCSGCMLHTYIYVCHESVMRRVIVWCFHLYNL